MAAPSNIRINPFTGEGGATTFVNFTETHIIPNASPYVIRLNEVPQKRDPSNVTVFFMNETTGAVTTTKLTEVAAAPGASQFRMDYSTNADGDENWNTGLVEFSATDKGKSVQITYTGMGTLAGVKSNAYPAWWNDRGDGSDGDFVPTAATTIDGKKEYRRVFIKSGITVTINKHAHICCQGAFINLGNITAAGKGGSGGAGGKPLEAVNRTEGDGGAGSAGSAANGGAGGGADTPHAKTGAGGAGWKVLGFTENKNIVQNMIYDVPLCLLGAGGGGGAGSLFASKNAGNGGAGGGSIIIVADSFKNSGTITANGSKGANAAEVERTGGGGGGGGGSVFVVTKTLVSKGTITVNGGAGGTGKNNGAAGEAGIVTVNTLGVM